MILQRMASAIKRQDWFQVTIEIFIVVIGIFLGLQVQAWYEDSAEKKREISYLFQLHDEVAVVQKDLKPIIAHRSLIDETLNGILDKRRENNQYAQFSNIECNAINASHVYTNIIPPLSVINELEQTGRSVIISSAELRSLITYYKTTKERADGIIDLILSGRIVLSREYPQFLDLGAHSVNYNDITGNYNNKCSVEAIKDDIGFKNNLINNTHRYTAYALAINNQYETLIRMHQLLDRELGILHEGDTP